MYRRKGRDNLDKYIVTGMTCSACQAHVEKAVSKLEGVDKVSVSLLTNEMTVDGSASSSDIIEAVEKAGYGASLGGEKKIGVNLAEEKEQSLKDNETPKLVKRLIWSVGFLLALMYITMGHNMLSWPLPSFLNHNHIGLAIIEMLIAIIVMEINKAFFVSGFRSLIHMAPNMDTLVAMGSGVSFGWSLYILMKMTYLYTTGTPNMELMNLYHNQLYFESAAMIPALITVGKTLESFSKGKTTNALKNLIKMAPKTASILENGEIIDKPIEEVKPGDIFVVKAGDSIPVDGIIIEGSSAVDESALTGESVPVDKNVNDEVSAATISSSGYFKARAVRTGEDTTFSQIIKMVSDAAGTKAPIARIADKVSGVFVPGVMIIALLVIIYYIISGNNISWALERGIAVLVISCPCALGLATPVAIMVGNGMGAKNGILFKTGEALETLGKTDIIALDKTGTITEGRADVTDIWTAPGINKDELMAMAFSLEKMSEHPLATAIVGYGENHGTQELKVDDYKVLAGNGLKGTINGNTIYGGSAAFIGTKAIVDKKTSDIISKFSGEGKTPLLFAKECNLLGIIAVADTIKEDSKSAIKQLENMGIEVYMLTGDNEQTARAIGKSAGIENVIAGVLPDGKETIIRKLQKQGRVAMVGDGINDAPALTRADTGIAIGAGTDVAIDSADVVLMNSRLSDVAAAVRLSRKTLKNIHENLFWAFAYNIILIPMAAGFYKGINMNPMWGAAAMSLSSFTVCMNALRLNLFKIHNSEHDRKRRSLKHNKSNMEDIEMVKTVKIEGMMCGHCEMTVKKTLEALDGVESAEVSHEKGNAVLTLSKDVSDDVIKEAVEAKDYKFVSVE